MRLRSASEIHGNSRLRRAAGSGKDKSLGWAGRLIAAPTRATCTKFGELGGIEKLFKTFQNDSTFESEKTRAFDCNLKICYGISLREIDE